MTTAPLDYYDNVRTDLIALIDGMGLEVLEVGCGTGATAAELLARRIARSVDGIESAPQIAAIASQRISSVHVQKVESFDFSGLNRTYDLVIFGDVLEHTIDPWSVVRSVATHCLKADGAILASIPNARCVSFWGPLLFRGRLDYAERGILDRTHLRWFTRKTMLELFDQAGLGTEVAGRRVIGDSRGGLVHAAGRILRDFGVTQYLIYARPR